MTLRTLADVGRQRLANQFLLTRPFTSAAGVVRALGAVQAQDYPGAKWALALRMRDPSDAAIERAMTSGAIIRTHVLRPTWHFVAREDVRWMVALTGPRVSNRMAIYNRRLELDASVFRKSHDVIARALEGGKHLTRQELARLFTRAGIEVKVTISVGTFQRLAHLMMQAELDMLICSGPLRGKQFTYALFDERVPPSKPLDRDEAILKLTRLYFASRSPATAQDFSWWSGLSVPDAKRGIEMAGKALKPLNAGGKSFLTAKGRPVPKLKSAHLLPNYDEYFIGHKDRSAIGERVRAARARWPEGSLFWNVVAVDGQLVGGWKRVPNARGVRLDVRLVTNLSAAERRTVIAAARRYAEFLAVPTEIKGLE